MALSRSISASSNASNDKISVSLSSLTTTTNNEDTHCQHQTYKIKVRDHVKKCLFPAYNAKLISREQFKQIAHQITTLISRNAASSSVMKSDLSHSTQRYIEKLVQDQLVSFSSYNYSANPKCNFS